MKNNLSRSERAKLRAQAQARMAQALAEVRAVVLSGVCPRCGSGLRRNLSLTGWWQCEQFGADGFRKDDAKPSCHWQGFTE
jgi:uncharacterized protein (DUF983 family)